MIFQVEKILIHETWDAPNWPEILAEYAREAAVEGLPSPTPNKELYTKLETSGLLHAFGAFVDKMLIGYITVVAAPSTHYETAIMFNTESFFVTKEHRKSGLGLKLLNEAERFAKSNGAYGLMVSARYGSNLMTVLDRRDYEETNRVFFKKFSHE